VCKVGKTDQERAQPMSIPERGGEFRGLRPPHPAHLTCVSYTGGVRRQQSPDEFSASAQLRGDTAHHHPLP
jgi:hypothetical protein